MGRKIEDLINEAERRMDIWRGIADDPLALRDRGKTREQAIALANYFEGRFEALCDARNIFVTSQSGSESGEAQ